MKSKTLSVSLCVIGIGLTWAQLHERIRELEGVKQWTARRRFDAMKAAHVIRQSGEKYRLK